MCKRNSTTLIFQISIPAKDVIQHSVLAVEMQTRMTQVRDCTQLAELPQQTGHPAQVVEMC